MNTVDVITRKRDGSALNDEEIRYMVDGYTAGDIPDYQMSAFLMAVYFQGMNEEETILLTKYMKESGDRWIFRGSEASRWINTAPVASETRRR